MTFDDPLRFNVVVVVRRSGNTNSADYFANHIRNIETEKDIVRFKNSLEQISSAGAMSQYANFTFKEDELLAICQKEAKFILSKYGANSNSK